MAIVEILRNMLLLCIFFIQLCIIFLHNRFGFLSFYTLGFVSSTLLGFSIFINDLNAFLPIYKHLSIVRNNPVLKLRLKCIYSLLATAACMIGYFSYSYFKWIFESVGKLGIFINSPNIGELHMTIISIIQMIFISKDNLPLLLCTLSSSSVFIISFLLSKKYGALSIVQKYYNKHEYRYILNRQENRIEIICLGAGVGINIYFTVIYLGFSALRGFVNYSFRNWIKNQIMSVDKVENNYNQYLHSIYKNIIVGSIVFMPFYNSSIIYQKIFILTLFAPMVFIILLDVVIGEFVQKMKFTIIILSIILTLSCSFAGIYQYIIYEANPLVLFTVNIVKTISRPEMVEPIKNVCKMLFLAMYLNYSINIWFNQEFKYRSGRDPIGLYYNHKLNYFIFSLVIRAVFIYYYFINYNNEFNNYIKIIFYSFSIISINILGSEQPEQYLKEMKSEFSQAEIIRSSIKSKNKLESFLAGC